jgi:predicted metalloprotease with PDZ domain
MKYIISFEVPNRHLLQIEQVIENIKPEEEYIDVSLPAFRPGRYELQNFAKNLKIFTAKNANGEQIPHKKVDRNTWRVFCKDLKEVHLHYEYYGATIDAGSTFCGFEQVYINPANCLMYNLPRLYQPHELILNLSSEYDIAVGLKRISNQSFIAQDYHELADCPLIASETLKHRSYTSHGIKFNIWLQGPCEVEWNKMLKDMERFSDAQIRLFGSAPFQEYHFLCQIMPNKAYHGVEHLNSTVLMIGPGADLMDDQYDEFMGLASHELFHAWNVKSIRPIEMMPYDYSKEAYCESHYITEGVTTYYGDLMLAKSGVWTTERYLEELSLKCHKHFTNYGRFITPLTLASFDSWIEGYADTIPHKKVSFYTKGCLVALMTDLEIRKATNHEKSLDTVMRIMYDRFGKSEVGYSQQNYKDILEEVSGLDFTSFFRDYIEGVKPIYEDFNKLLEFVGCKLVESPGLELSEYYYGFVATGSEKANRLVVKTILPNSPAEISGLDIGDEILAVNNIKIGGKLNNLIRNHTRHLNLIVARESKIFTIQLHAIPNTYFNPVVEVVKIPGLADDSFNQWLSL